MAEEQQRSDERLRDEAQPGEREKPAADELDLSGVVWRRGAPGDAEDVEEGGGRLEVAFLEDGKTLMRDGEDPEGPVLVFTPQEWEAFVGGVKDGEFDLSETHPGLWKDEEPDQEEQG